MEARKRKLGPINNDGHRGERGHYFSHPFLEEGTMMTVDEHHPSEWARPETPPGDPHENQKPLFILGVVSILLFTLSIFVENI